MVDISFSTLSVDFFVWPITINPIAVTLKDEWKTALFKGPVRTAQ
jgi:hypothetical protein